MRRRDFFRVVPAVPGAFLLTGCSTSSVIMDIQIAVDAVSIAAPIIATFAGPGAGLILNYTTAAINGLNCVLAAASAPGATSLLISQAVAHCLATVIAPTLPAGTPQLIVNLIDKIVTAIAGLVTKYGTPAALKTARAANVSIRLNHTDHSKLSAMHSKLDAAMVALVNKP